MVDISFTQADIECFILILVRITSFMFTAPFFSQANTPARLKIGFAVFLSFILYLVLPDKTVDYSSIWEYSTIVIKEAIAGLLLGFFTQICNMVIIFAGKIIDFETGLSMAEVYDPNTRSQVSIVGNLYSYSILLLLLATNMHKFLLGAVVDSFTVAPLGEVVIQHSLLDTFLGFVGNYFIIGFEICLPIFAMGLVLNAVLGIMAKVAPQMNMFAVGIQIKVIAGLIVIFITTALLPTIANLIFDQMRLITVDVLQGLH